MTRAKKASGGRAAKSKGAKASAKASAAKPALARTDNGAVTRQAQELAQTLRGAASVRMLTGEAAYYRYASDGVLRQIIGRFATLMTSPGYSFTHSDVREFDWAPTMSMLDDLRLRAVMREAAIWAFVFGAGIIEHVVDDAERSSEDPLDLANVRAYKGFRIHTAHSLRPVNRQNWQTAEWFDVVYGQGHAHSQQRIHRSRLSFLVALGMPPGMTITVNNGWPPSWLSGVSSEFDRWERIEDDAAGIVHTLSILHLQLHGYAQASDNPDTNQGIGLQNRLSNTLATLSAHGLLVSDTQDGLSEVSRSITGLADLIERAALRAASASGVTKELVLMEAEGNLGDNSAPIDAYYDMISGWADIMISPVIARAAEIANAVRRYQARLAGDGVLLVPAQFLVKLDSIQQPTGKDRAEQRYKNAQAREIDARANVPKEVILGDPSLRADYPTLDAWLEDQATREELARKKAAEAGLDNPVGETMVSAAQAARPFNISATTLIKMAKAGKVRGHVIAGRWKFYLSQVAEVLTGKSQTEIEQAADQRLDDIGLSESTTFGGAWGQSDAMREIFAVLERVRDSGLAVLLLGETGTGKEGIARGLHVDGPFVAISCAEFDDDPADAAKQLRKALAAAAGGTLFLDEVGDMPREVQSALLRVLSMPHDARIVSATSLDARDPWVLRPDLYHRLAEVEVEIPPLRDRETDVIELATRIYAEYVAARGYEAAEPPFTDAALAAMQVYPWPGNIRELKSAVSRGVEIAPRGASVGVDDLQLRR